MEPRLQPVFSPSQTTDWLEDPTNWYLSRILGWKPKYLGKKHVAGILGTAFADGIAIYNNWVIAEQKAVSPQTAVPGKEVAIKAAAKVAEQRARDDMAKVVAEGRSVYEGEAPSWEALPERAATAVIKYCLADPVPPSWKLVHAELTMPDHGYCRIDAGYDTPLGPAVADYKTKVTLDARYENQTLAEYQFAWAMMHYTWSYGEYRQLPTRQFAILLLILEPKKRAPVFHPVIVEPEHMAIWLSSARRVWRVMEGMRTGTALDPAGVPWFDGKPWVTFRFFTRFGRTDWADAVTTYKLDETLMRQGYVKGV